MALFKRFSYIVDKETNNCMIYDMQHELPKITLPDHKEAKELTYFLNIQQTHMKNMENLMRKDTDLQKQIETHTEVMHNELLDIFVQEAEAYRTWKSERLGSSLFKDNIAVKVLDNLAHDLGLLKWNEDLESVKFKNSYNGRSE